MWSAGKRGLAALLLVALAAFFIFAPGIVERQRNVIDGEPLPAISAEAQALHDTLLIVDLHGDTLLWDRDLNARAERGHMDLPRLQDGNVALQVFSSVTKTPRGQNYDGNSGDTDNITLLAIGQLQPVRTWTSLLERTLYHGEKLREAVDASDGALVMVAPGRALDALVSDAQQMRPDTVFAMLSVEGLHNLEGDLANLVVLHEAGVGMAGLTHFFDNELAGSMHGIERGGLTAMGRDAVIRMEELGIIVDIAHCSEACVAEILAMARRPVVSSHGGVQATCDINRNLSDEQIRGVAATGGVIGIGYWPGAVCDTSPAAIVRAMRHVRDLVGPEYVALGSDFDGNVTARFDTSQLVQVTQALMDDGWKEADIRKVMGENALRVLSDGIRPIGAYQPRPDGTEEIILGPMPPTLPGPGDR
ncbi:dipeptidase [Aurantiacibacter gangjinensis]|uniref:dipeptidase n=1 Tax=Aurantiacibacter gangjinensis TaxID=502682 RepID=UPI0007ED8A1F|nr:dipeptidase [Aurantiacibacter gangjinensis]APE27591.1 Microsomal dipeptidase [Aurantiacibacter gangjinensis]